MTSLDRIIADRLAGLIRKAETGEDWAEICRLEAEMTVAAAIAGTRVTAPGQAQHAPLS